MKLRLFFILGTVVLIAQADSSAANPRHKRTTSSHVSRGAVPVQDSAGAAVVQQQQPMAPSQSATESVDTVPTITISGGNDPAEARYEQAKSKAKEDPAVKALKARADQAATEDEARQASVAYNKALFRKVREIDREAADHASAVEFAIIRRINQ